MRLLIATALVAFPFAATTTAQHPESPRRAAPEGAVELEFDADLVPLPPPGAERNAPRRFRLRSPAGERAHVQILPLDSRRPGAPERRFAIGGAEGSRILEIERDGERFEVEIEELEFGEGLRGRRAPDRDDEDDDDERRSWSGRIEIEIEGDDVEIEIQGLGAMLERLVRGLHEDRGGDRRAPALRFSTPRPGPSGPGARRAPRPRATEAAPPRQARDRVERRRIMVMPRGPEAGDRHDAPRPEFRRSPAPRGERRGAQEAPPSAEELRGLREELRRMAEQLRRLRQRLEGNPPSRPSGVLRSGPDRRPAPSRTAAPRPEEGGASNRAVLEVEEVSAPAPRRQRI